MWSLSTGEKPGSGTDFASVSTGEVPAKRVERKCQQLENLVTAVQAVAQPGDVIVDFCSGGVSLRCGVYVGVHACAFTCLHMQCCF